MAKNTYDPEEAKAKTTWREFTDVKVQMFPQA
jgi:hypothetical protein